MDKDKIRNIKYAANKFLGLIDIFPPFINRLIKELKDIGVELGANTFIVNNDESKLLDPDPEEISLKIQGLRKNNLLIDLDWWIDAGYFSFQGGIREEGDFIPTITMSTEHIGNDHVDKHIEELIKELNREIK